MQTSLTLHRHALGGAIYRRQTVKLIEVLGDPRTLEATVVVVEDDLGRALRFDAGNGLPLEAGSDACLSPLSRATVCRDYRLGRGQLSLPGVDPPGVAPVRPPKAR